MPPVLDATRSKVDGLAFLGLSLCRKSPEGNQKSQTHQTAFDLNQVLDREYRYIFSTNDDGWLVGGGEPGPPESYKLAAPDSAHVEVLRIGTYKPQWGGLTQEQVLDAFQSGQILVPQITAVPTAVVANADKPPELEIRFDMEAALHDPEPDSDFPALPVNWQLRFLHNQLFRHFEFPSRFCPGAFHSTIVRKAEFRSEEAKEQYFDMCKSVVKGWRHSGPQPLVAPVTKNIQKVVLPETKVQAGVLGSSPEYTSGLWLFTDRNTITHQILPNFLPPYDTPEKRKIIYEVLSEEWDETSLEWKTAPALPRPELLNPKPTAKSIDANCLACGVETLCSGGP